ncbi:FAD binding domain-containing protein [Rhizohabitans arisaemae]|uniref:FAD binding domain-containing protein n=1 Tax=Rhizohabitans arisaemae TaxID=2720610 RepID=UPI0024B09E39|nr:xanthine dehydrogenase family protein subunit M [Rhizohabitans arisaemae]
MRPFVYRRPGDARTALAELAAEPGAMYLGGGTNLVDLMRLGVLAPRTLVDVTRACSDAIEVRPDGGLWIGAGVRNADLAAHPAVRRRYPMLAQALLSGASGQIRNMATVAGNLLQRTRCAYFQDPSKPCNKARPGTGCPARAGDHRNLAILGYSDFCVATHPSDMAVALTALGAVVHVEGAAGPYTVRMPGLHRLPGDEPERDTVLEPGDLIIAVEIPALPYAACSRYRKVRDRASFAFTVVSVAAAVDKSGGTIRDCRIALGGVAPVPWRAERAEAELRGAPIAEASFRRAADAELTAARPLTENGFKVALVRNVVVRALLDLVGVS